MNRAETGDNAVKDSDPVENLGQVLFGERLRASAYDVSSTFVCVPIYLMYDVRPNTTYFSSSDY